MSLHQHVAEYIRSRISVGAPPIPAHAVVLQLAESLSVDVLRVYGAMGDLLTAPYESPPRIETGLE